MEAVALLQSTSILVGIHGADLANAYFLPANATVVEVLGEHFASGVTYAFRAYQRLAQTHLLHKRLVVQESDPACVKAALAWCARQNSTMVVMRPEEGPKPCDAKDRLIDCPVDVHWSQLGGLLRLRSRTNPLEAHYSFFRRFPYSERA